MTLYGKESMANIREIPQIEMKRSLDAATRLYAQNAGKGLRYHIEAYGCQMNAHEAETMAGYFEMMGYSRAPERDSADLIVFNTCCVREHAEKRVFGNIGALKKRKEENPDLRIAVCGCMTQQEEVAARLYRRFPFVDMVTGTNELHLLPQLMERVAAGERVLTVRHIDGEVAEGMPVRRASGYTASVNIMYGCNNFCSYCVVPLVRGRERSRSAQSVLEEARAALAEGYREIMLLGQNVNSYRGEGADDFPALLSMVNGLAGLERLRFMTSHPKDLSPRLIDAFASLDKLCAHIHLPVQSGSDRILAAMNRRYTRDEYLRLVEALRKKMPEIAITTDIIVGFPGEEEEDFAHTLSLMREAGFAASYTFMYSKRKGTKAALMEGQIEEAVKKERLARLNAQQEALTREANLRMIGQQGDVIVEGMDRRGAPMLYGKLRNGRMVYFPGPEELIDKTVWVKVSGTQSNSLSGVMLR